MITCHKSYLITRCHERGHTLGSVMPCVVAQDGDQWTIDETHPAYPHKPRQSPAPSPAQDGPPETVEPRPKPKGTGDHLHDLIHWFTRQEPTWSCGCKRLIREMNAWGPDGCWKRRKEIVDHMMQEAKDRDLKLWPGSRAGATVLLRWAVARARREG